MAGIFSVLLAKQQASPFVADADCFQSRSVPFLDTCSWNLKGKQCTLNLKNALQISEQKGLGKLEGVKETVSQCYWGHVWQTKRNLQSILSQDIFTSYNLHRQVGGHTSSCSCFSANRTRRVLIFLIVLLIAAMPLLFSDWLCATEQVSSLNTNTKADDDHADDTACCCEILLCIRLYLSFILLTERSLLWFNSAGSSAPHSGSLTPASQWDGERIRKKQWSRICVSR